MQKLDIATRIHQQAGIPIDEAAKLLEWVLGFLKVTLQGGESITINGFGKFTVRHKLARIGRNPKTGEAVTIPARRVVTFHASHLFKAHVNSLSEEGTVGEKEAALALHL
jgi:integration host factor subunit alpha